MMRRFVEHEEGFVAGTPAATAPHLMTIIWRRKVIFFSAIIVALIAGWIIFNRITPLYSSSTKLHLKENAPKIILNDLAASAAPTFSVNTEFEIIRSTAVLQNALQNPAMQAVQTLRGVDNPIEALKGLLQISSQKADDIILISADCTRPEDAAAIVNSVADAYIDYNKQQQRSTTADLMTELRRQRDETDKQKREIVARLNEMRKTDMLVQFEGGKGNVEMARLQELQTQLSGAEKARTAAKVTADRLDELKDYPVPLKAFIISKLADMNLSPSVLLNQSDQNQMALSQSLRDLESRYGALHPEVARVRAMLSQNEQVGGDSQLVEAFRIVAAQNVATAVKYEEELRTQFNHQREIALNLSAKEQEMSELEADRDNKERMLTVLDSRIEEVNANNGVKGQITVSTLDVGKPNPMPVSPQKNKIMGLALVAGLALGMSLAMVRDLLDQRLRSLAEIEDTLGMRILGTVPTLGKRVHAFIAGRTVDTRPVSDVAEAYRSIRTSLLVARESSSAKTILITSATPGEGKTTTASNLAIAAAQMGRKVLIIDADCRMPSLQNIFKIEDGMERGLSDIVLNGVKPTEVIRPTGIDNLDIITTGPLSGRPAEMLNGAGFKRLLREMSSEYEHVFIDSPPVIPVTDARVISALCDVSILVLRAEKSTRSQALRARDALEGVGGRLLGVVVNDAPRRQAQYGCDFEVYPARGFEDQPEQRVRSQRRAVRRAVPTTPALPEEKPT